MIGPELAQTLLVWWDREQAPLPWRRNRNPYSVWVSETMLQQTVVKAVVPHYLRWMRTYPDVLALARSSEAQVTRLWEGLGYYSRARNLLAAARLVAVDFGGRVPDDYESLRRLPGIGDYTARAILSIGYGIPWPVIDANVRRVIRRLLLWRDWDAGRRRQALETLAGVIPAARPGDFNEALMELGQTICLKRQPVCGACPLAQSCRARSEGLQARIPPPVRSSTRSLASRVLVLLRDGAVRVTYHTDGLFRGLWTLPRIAPGVDPPAGVVPIGALRERTHAYTRYRERLHPRVFEAARGVCSGDGEWATLDRLESLPMPSVYRKIVEDLKTFLDQPALM